MGVLENVFYVPIFMLKRLSIYIQLRIKKREEKNAFIQIMKKKIMINL